MFSEFFVCKVASSPEFLEVTIVTFVEEQVTLLVSTAHVNAPRFPTAL